MEPIVVHLGKEEFPKFVGLAHKHFLGKNFDSLNELLRQALEKKGDVVLWRDTAGHIREKAGWIAVAYRPPKILWSDLGTVASRSYWTSVNELKEFCLATPLLGTSKEFLKHIATLLDQCRYGNATQVTIVFKHLSRNSVTCTMSVHEKPLVR